MMPHTAKNKRLKPNSGKYAAGNKSRPIFDVRTDMSGLKLSIFQYSGYGGSFGGP